MAHRALLCHFAPLLSEQEKKREDPLPFCLRYFISFFFIEPPKYLPDLCDELFGLFSPDFFLKFRQL